MLLFKKIIELSKNNAQELVAFLKILHHKTKILSKTLCISCRHFSKVWQCVSSAVCAAFFK